MVEYRTAFYQRGRKPVYLYPIQDTSIPLTTPIVTISGKLKPISDTLFHSLNTFFSSHNPKDSQQLAENIKTPQNIHGANFTIGTIKTIPTKYKNEKKKNRIKMAL